MSRPFAAKTPEATVATNPRRSKSAHVRADRPTPDEVIARARLYFAVIVIVGIFICCVGLGVFALMAVPLAHAIAGKHTDFSFTFSLSLSATLAVSTAVTSGGWILQSRRARRYKDRTKELEAKLEVLGKSQPERAGQTKK
jgi:hypothetical protein